MSIEEMSLDLFLTNNHISHNDWSRANIEYDDLKIIAVAHRDKTQSLIETAGLLARMMEMCAHVHSVRWRVATLSKRP